MMILFVFALNFYASFLALIFFRIVIPKLILKFFGLGTMPEHWLDHDESLSVFRKQTVLVISYSLLVIRDALPTNN